MYKRDDFRERMRYAAPLWWQDIQEMKNIQDRAADELGIYSHEFQRYVDARSPITADAEKLIKWEVMHSIKPDLNKPLRDRRDMVLAKMRGRGIVTKAMLKKTIESFNFGDVDIQQRGGRVIIRFVSTYGIPAFLDEIKRLVRGLVPAHLEIEYEFLYNTYADVRDAAASYAVLKQSGLTYEELLYTELDFGDQLPPGGIEFYDYLDGVSQRNVTLLRESAELRTAAAAGATTLTVNVNAFQPGTLVTIYDDAHSEVLRVEGGAGSALNVSALQHAYKRGAKVERSTAVRQDGAGFGTWTSYQFSATEVE